MERVKRFELSTPTLARLYSTTELHPLRAKNQYMKISTIVTQKNMSSFRPFYSWSLCCDAAWLSESSIAFNT